MPRLIHLNGPSRVGKSTLARRWADDHPGTLVLDLDVLAGLVGGWRDDFSGALATARGHGREVAARHLAAGHDVVLPQLVTSHDRHPDPAFEETARAAGAAYVQVALVVDDEEHLRRLRAKRPDHPVEARIQSILEEPGSDLVDRIRGHLADYLARRPGVVRLDTTGLPEDETYRRLLRVLAEPETWPARHSGSMTSRMRAVRLEEYGDEGVLDVREVDRPAAGSDRVLVQVVATSINPGEAMIREGVMDPDRTATFPMGEGSDLAGRVVEVGSGVDGWDTGDEVLGWSDERSAHAEYVAVPPTQLVRRPDGVTWEQAGSLYVAGGTAVALHDAAAPSRGETVVVTAAAGGVGSILVQLLVRDGVRVLGVAGPDNDAWLSDLGVAPVNRGDGLAERLREAAPDGVDAFLDCFGQGYTDLAIGLGVAPERVVTIADFEAAQGNGARVVFGHQSTTASTLAELAGLVAAGDLVVTVAATYALDDVQAAYTELSDRRTRGKIVLLP